MIWEYRDILGQTIIYKNLVKLKNLYESRRFFLRDFCSSKCLNTSPSTNTPHPPKKKRKILYCWEYRIDTVWVQYTAHKNWWNLHIFWVICCWNVLVNWYKQVNFILLYVQLFCPKLWQYLQVVYCLYQVLLQTTAPFLLKNDKKLYYKMIQFFYDKTLKYFIEKLCSCFVTKLAS